MQVIMAGELDAHLPPLKKSRVAAGSTHSESGVVPAVSSASAGRSRRADPDDGWPRINHGFTGAFGESYSRLSQNTEDHWDIRAHCGICGCEVNSTCQPQPQERNAQGRPIGALWAWLSWLCDADRQAHKNLGWENQDDRIMSRSRIINENFWDPAARQMLREERRPGTRWDDMGEPRVLP